MNHISKKRGLLAKLYQVVIFQTWKVLPKLLSIDLRHGHSYHIISFSQL